MARNLLKLKSVSNWKVSQNLLKLEIVRITWKWKLSEFESVNTKKLQVQKVSVLSKTGKCMIRKVLESTETEIIQNWKVSKIIWNCVRIFYNLRNHQILSEKNPSLVVWLLVWQEARRHWSRQSRYYNCPCHFNNLQIILHSLADINLHYWVTLQHNLKQPICFKNYLR